MIWKPIGEEFISACDALAGSSPHSGFMQSAGWARFKELEGYTLTRLGLFENETLKGFVNGFTFLRGTSQSSEFFICPEGPVLDWSDQEAARLALRELTVYVKEHDAEAVGVRIQPQLPQPSPSFIRNWLRGPVDVTPEHTLYVGLEGSEQDWIERMKPKGRYNLRVSQRHGVKVRTTSDPSILPEFHKLFIETAHRNHFFAEPLSFFMNLGESLFKSHTAELLLAEHEGEVLAGIIVVYFGRRATYLYGASTSSNRRVMPNFPLHLEAMHRAKARGCVEYDLYGYDPFGRVDHLYAGISRFKKQWGGLRQVRIGARDYVFYDRLAELLVEKLGATEVPA